MKRSILTFLFAVATLPVGFAQTQTQSTTEQPKEHSATTVNSDGTAVHSTAKERESRSSTSGVNGTTTTKARQSKSKTKVKNSDGVEQTTTEHHATSDSTKTTSTPPQL